METTAPRADNSTSCLHILKKKTLTIIILIMANHYLDLLIACCNRGQTSDIHGTFQVFVAMASWQNVEACMLVPITMYIIELSLTRWGWVGVFLLIPYWSPILGYIQRNHVLIDIFSHRCGWLLIFKQEDDWLIYSSCIQATHPQWSIFIEEKKNIWKRFRYWNYWGFQLERYPISLYLNYEDLIINKGW